MNGNRRRATAPAPRSWVELRPALTLWLLLLASNLALGLYARLSGDRSPFGECVATAVDLGIIAWFALPRRRQLLPLLRPASVTVSALTVALLATIGCGVLLVGYFWLVSHLTDLEEYLGEYRQHNWPVWSAIVLIAVVPPVAEEITFRGILFTSLQRALGTRDALLVQAILFGILHMSLFMFPSHIFMGWVLGRLRLHTNSLLPGMFMHACWNGGVLFEEWCRTGAGG